MLTVKAPAKINWFLRVKGTRPDGYHEILSLIQCVSLFDTLTFEESKGISVITEAPVPGDENLVTKAALMLREKTGIKRGARISLVKKIPIAAGLGGGSSDAASTLKGLTTLWGLNLPHHELQDMASGLGSDVPFFLGGPASLVSGRGEDLSPVNITQPLTLLLLNPSVTVSAGWAYSAYAGFSEENPEYADEFMKALEAGDLAKIGEIAVNDLEGPVLKKHPIINEFKENLRKAGALFSAMSGSGPTVFGIFTNRGQAVRAEAAIQAPWSAVVETLV